MHNGMASISNKECSPMVGGHLQNDLPSFYQQPEAITEWAPFLNPTSYDKPNQSSTSAGGFDLPMQQGMYMPSLRGMDIGLGQ